MEAVRAARAADAERICELAGEFVDAMGSRRGAALVVGPDRDGMARIDGPGDVASALGDPSRLALVGTLDEIVVGFALCHLEESEGGGCRGVLDACYVEPEGRVLGLGRMLIDQTLVWCTDRGCSGIDGFAFPGDREAKNFFESAGFKARLLVMHRDIE